LPPPPPSPLPPSPLPANQFACAAFTLASGKKYVDCKILIPAGQTVHVGTCGVAGSTCYGDTKLALLSYMGNMLASNDNGTSVGCGACSLLNYTNTYAFATTHVLRQQCIPLRSGTCGGISAYVFRSGATPLRSLIEINPDMKDTRAQPADGGGYYGEGRRSPPRSNSWIIGLVSVGCASVIVGAMVCSKRDALRYRASYQIAQMNKAVVGARRRARNENVSQLSSFKISL
jgi:hypothetical protein